MVLAVGTFVSVLGLTATATGQISSRFDELTATTITATDARQATDVQSLGPVVGVLGEGFVDGGATSNHGGEGRQQRRPAGASLLGQPDRWGEVEAVEESVSGDQTAALPAGGPHRWNRLTLAGVI